MQLQSTAVNENFQKRLRRIEGQMRGIERMVDEGRDCREIVQQLSAAQAALKNAKQMFMRAYAKECLAQTAVMDPLDREALIDDVMDLLAKV